MNHLPREDENIALEKNNFESLRKEFVNKSFAELHIKRSLVSIWLNYRLKKVNTF
ncbi:MAG: hypothetical protein ACI9DK_003084 [Vicingaceae bacterium]|jgi:hypothetical protein